MERRCGADAAALTDRPRAWLATGAALLVLLAIGAAAIWYTTVGLHAWTSESLRRVRVLAQPPLLSPLPLLTQDGTVVAAWGTADALPRVHLVSFIYTGCLTLCLATGNELAQIQRELGSDAADARIALLSISFDIARDTPRELQQYARRFHADPARWRIAVPRDGDALQRLLREAGVVVIDDGLGGFAHNAAIAVVTSSGRLIGLFDYDRHREALAFARAAAS